MLIPKIKNILIFIIFFIFSLIILFFIVFFTYDKKISGNSNINKITKNEKNKYYILNIENRISSEIFYNFLLILNYLNPKYICIDLNYKNIDDSIKLNEIKSLISNTKNIFGYINLKHNKKGFKIFSDNIEENNLKNFVFLKSKYSFYYSNYLENIKIENQFDIPSERIGFITEKEYNNNINNLNLILKFRNKYLLSLPLIIYYFENNFDINKISYEYSIIKYNNKNILFYDQKGEATFKYQKEKVDLTINNFLDWQQAISARIKIIQNLNNLNLLKISNQENTFKNEEEFIDNLYNIKFNSKNENDIVLFQETLNLVPVWKSFKGSISNKITNGEVFIIQHGKSNIITTFHYEKYALHNGKNFFRIPIIYIYFFLLFLLLLSLLIAVYEKKIYSFFIFITILILFEFVFYYIFLDIFKIDFPVFSFIIINIYCIIIGTILREISKYNWIKEVSLIYKNKISEKHKIILANLWRENNLLFESKSLLTTFMSIDISEILINDKEEDLIEIIQDKIKEIIKIIKDNFGIISDINPAFIYCYFGTPPIEQSNVFSAINCAKELNKIQIIFNNIKKNLIIAIHSKNEWFKFINNNNEKSYINIGNSINILSGMKKVAKKFNIKTIISDNVFKLCNLNIPVRMLDKIKIRNIDNIIRVFELLSEEQIEKNERLYDYFHAGLKLFEQKKWNEASYYFRQCLKLDDKDIPSKIYFDRCKEYMYAPPMDNWNGVYEVD